MNDKQFYKAIERAHRLAIEHRNAMIEAEKEYAARFGNIPSEYDDDWWIDHVHYGMGALPALETFIEHGERHLPKAKNKQP